MLLILTVRGLNDMAGVCDTASARFNDGNTVHQKALCVSVASNMNALLSPPPISVPHFSHSVTHLHTFEDNVLNCTHSLEANA